MKSSSANKSFILIFVLLLISTISRSQNCNLFFDFDRDQLRLNDIAKLDKLINAYKMEPRQIKIVGFADTSGAHTYNIGLSSRRANKVKEYFISKGIERNMVITEPKGEIFQRGTEQLYSRRVEVSLVSGKSMFSSLSEFRKSLIPGAQVFKIPVDEDVEVEGNKGTIINIDASSFVSKEGKDVFGQVNLELVEFYTMEDFFSEALSTCSDTSLLSSAGMVKVAVSQNGVELKLKEGKDIQLYFPRSNNETYTSFNGVRKPDGSMNWIEAKKLSPSKNKSRANEAGVTIGEDGTTLILIDKNTADKRNRELTYNPVLKKFSKMSEEERKVLESYRNEQMRTDLKRGDMYSFISSSRLGFINCDRFLNNRSNIFVNCNLKIENRNLSITSAAFIFRESNAYLEFTQKGLSSALLGYFLPTDEKVELLVIGSSNDVPYLYHKEIILTEKMNEIITLNASSFEEIKAVF